MTDCQSTPKKPTQATLALGMALQNWREWREKGPFQRKGNRWPQKDIDMARKALREGADIHWAFEMEAKGGFKTCEEWVIELRMTQAAAEGVALGLWELSLGQAADLAVSAAISGDAIGLRRLAEVGVSLDAVNEKIKPNERTPFFLLHLAARHLRPEAVETLLALGQDPNQRWQGAGNDAGKTGGTALQMAIHAGDADKNERAFAVVQSLLAHGADANARSRGRGDKGTPMLHFAAECGRFKIARLLVDSGADWTAPGARGETALDLARSKTADGGGDWEEIGGVCGEDERASALREFEKIGAEHEARVIRESMDEVGSCFIEKSGAFGASSELNDAAQIHASPAEASFRGRRL